MKLLVLIWLVLLASDLFGCSCDRVGILKDQKDAGLVFVGRVIKVNEVISREKLTWGEREIEYRRVEFVFKVKSIYKGRRNEFMKDTVTVITTGGGADCGNRFYENKKYLVYAYKSDKKLNELSDQSTDTYITTRVCTRTKKAGPLTIFERIVLKLS